MTTALSSWTHRLTDVSERGLEVRRSATPEERAAAAAELDLLSCDRLDVDYRIREMAGGRYRLTGRFVADVVQACVVTLEPVADHIEEELDEEFWPEEQIPKSGAGLEGEQEALAATIAEPIESGRLEVGRVFYERLGTALEPFPRKPGAELDLEAINAASDVRPAGPFAVLAKLKKDE